MSNDQTKTAYGSPPLSIPHIYLQYSDCFIIFLLVLQLLAGIDLRGQADRASGIISNLRRLVLRLLRHNVLHVCSRIVKVDSTKSIVIISSKDQDTLASIKWYQFSGCSVRISSFPRLDLFSYLLSKKKPQKRVRSIHPWSKPV